MTTISPGVIAELEAWDRHWGEYSSLADVSHLEAYIRESGSLAPETYSFLFSDQLHNTGVDLKVLDIGVGTGASSLFLGSKGYKVTAVEPYNNFCDLINYSAIKFGLDVRAVCAVAEDLNVLLSEKFDIVIFNSSLHHCDSPSKALDNCFSVLAPGGKIWLVNESFLRPWKTKKWFYRMLDEEPEIMGHYGGNEHVYYNWEYLNMLRKAGFIGVGALGVQTKDIFDRIECLLLRRLNGVRVENRPVIFAMKILFFVLQNWLSKFRLVSLPLIKMSIFAGHFVGTKPNV